MRNEHYFKTGAAAKSVMLMLAGPATRQDAVEQPNRLEQWGHHSQRVLSEVVLPACAFFEVYFNAGGVLRAEAILTASITSWERSMKDKVEWGIWTNEWRQQQLMTRRGLTPVHATVCRGFFSPFLRFRSQDRAPHPRKNADRCGG